MISDSKLAGLLALVMLFAGCAGGAVRPTSQPETTIVVEQAPSGAIAAADGLPPLPVAIVEDPQGAGRRIEQIDLVDQDLRLVLRSLAESFGLDYRLDPTITGSVTTRLQDVTLQEALDAIVLPYGFSYALEGNVLRVTPTQMVTRIFSLDYVSMSRTGIGSTVVQRRLGGGSVGGAGNASNFGGAGGGADIIESVTIADLWAEIQVSLEGLLFASSSFAAPAGAVTPSNQANVPGGTTAATGIGGGSGGGLAGSRGPTAFSRTDGEGRRLLINPIAGTILVSGTPRDLEEAGALIAAIEGSVHRQVLIEARIVEVALNRDFEFGIDWTAVQRLGGLAIELGVGAAGTELRINTGTDADQEIGAVLRALESQGNVNVLSAPRVSVLNNQRASFGVTTDEVFFAVTRQPIIGANGGTIGFDTQIEPQQIAVGIVLDVLAQIAADNTVTMNIRPAITDIVEVRELVLEDGTQASAPVIDRRETDTVVRVRNGETIVIGGLMRTSLVRNETGIPGLSRLPLIGRIFGGYREQSEKRELVIFITPTVIAGQPSVAR